MSELQNLKKIKYILEEEVLSRLFKDGIERANVKEALLVVDKMIETKTKKTKTVKKSSTKKAATKKAAKKKPPEMFSWEWWMAT